MALGDKLSLHTIALTTQWQMLSAPISCNAVEGTGDVNWEWRTNGGGTKAILAGICEQIAGPGYMCRFGAGEEVCEVKGAQEGMLWIKCVR